MNSRHDSFNDDALVRQVAEAESWDANEQRQFETLREAINGKDRVEEAFLIVRSGEESLIARAVGVASWPRWDSVRLGDGDKKILDALALLASKL